jgi:hypothetical protein
MVSKYLTDQGFLKRRRLSILRLLKTRLKHMAANILNSARAVAMSV